MRGSNNTKSALIVWCALVCALVARVEQRIAGRRRRRQLALHFGQRPASGRQLHGDLGQFVARAVVLHAQTALVPRFDQDAQRGLGDAVAVHQGLQGEGPLRRAGGGDDGFFDFHSQKRSWVPRG